MSVSKTYSKMIGYITVVCKKQTFFKAFIKNVTKAYQNLNFTKQTYTFHIILMVFNYIYIYTYIHIYTIS